MDPCREPALLLLRCVQVAQRSCGRPIPGSVQGHIGASWDGGRSTIPWDKILGIWERLPCPWKRVGLDDPEGLFPPKPSHDIYFQVSHAPARHQKNPNQLFHFLQLLIIPGLHLPENLILPYFFGDFGSGFFPSPPLSPSKAFSQSVLLVPRLFPYLWNTRPLNQDFPGYPGLFNRFGRSENFIEKPCGIRWKIGPLPPLLLTFSFCSISPRSLFSHLPRPPSRLRQKLLHPREERLGILSGSCRSTRIIPSGCFSESSRSCRDVRTPSTGVSPSCSSFFSHFFAISLLSFLLLLPPSFFGRSLLELSRIRCLSVSLRMMEMFGLGKISMLKESQPFLQHC